MYHFQGEEGARFQGHCIEGIPCRKSWQSRWGSPRKKKCQHCGLQVGWKHASFCGESRILHVFYGWGGARGGGCDTGSWWHPRCAASVTPRWPSVQAPPATNLWQLPPARPSHQVAEASGHFVPEVFCLDIFCENISVWSFGVVNSRNFKYLSRKWAVPGGRTTPLLLRKILKKWILWIDLSFQFGDLERAKSEKDTTKVLTCFSGFDIFCTVCRELWSQWFENLVFSFGWVNCPKIHWYLRFEA